MCFPDDEPVPVPRRWAVNAERREWMELVAELRQRLEAAEALATKHDGEWEVQSNLKQKLASEVKRLRLMVMDLKEIALENDLVYVDSYDTLRFTDTGEEVGSV